MSDIRSALGLSVQTPWGPRKSGTPESVEMPAPVSATTRRASSRWRRATASVVIMHHATRCAARHQLRCAAGAERLPLRPIFPGGARMADANVRLSQSMYEAFGRGDADAVLGAFDPGIVWHEAENIAYADRNPYVGPQQVAEGVFGRIMTGWDGFTVNPDKIVHEGDTAVALGRYRGTHRSTGEDLDAQFAHVWTFSNGKIVGFQQYADTAQFLRVAGPPVLASS